MQELLDITDQFLVNLAGQAAFRRGRDYFNQGHVLEWHKKGNTVTGLVSGTDTWHVTLKHTNRQFEGHCDCPASDGFDFCKHCVAVALCYRQESTEQVRLEDGNQLERIKAYIRKLDKSEVQQSLMALIEDDSSLIDQWSLRADLALNRLDYKALRKRITAALPYKKNLFSYAQARSYFARAEITISILEEQAPQLPADKALLLVEYALKRLSKALETVDDSGGYRMNVTDILHSLHITTLERRNFTPAKLVAHLEKIESSTENEMYPRIPDSYKVLMGDTGFKIYLQNKRSQWGTMPPLPPGADWNQKYPYLHIQKQLLEDARSRNDIDAEIALLEKTVTDVFDCEKFCERLIELKRWQELDAWLTKGEQWQSKDTSMRFRQHNQLKRLRLKLLLHRGDIKGALELQWLIYTSSTSLSDYISLLAIADDDTEKEHWKNKAIVYLRDSIGSSQTGYFTSRPLDQLIELYLYENRNEDALLLAHQNRISLSSLKSLIQAYIHDPLVTIPLYQRLVEDQVNRANNDAYQEAVSLLQKNKSELKNKNHRDLFQELLDFLTNTFKAKRNFIKFMKEAELI